jgi:hypothetical protein
MKKEKEMNMAGKQMVSVFFFAAAAMALNAAPIWAQSRGETQSERTDNRDANPLPEGSSYGGTTGSSKAGKGPRSEGQASGETADKETSIGGTKSERTDGRDAVPLPEGSSFSGSGEPSKAGKGPKAGSSQPEGSGSMR